MSSQNDLGFVSLLATSSISAFVSVDLNSDGSISPATGAGGYRGVGVTQEGGIAGRYLNVKLWTAPGTQLLTVSPGHVVTIGSTYGISNGYVVQVATPGQATASIEAFQTGVSASGIVLEFVKL